MCRSSSCNMYDNLVAFVFLFVQVSIPAYRQAGYFFATLEITRPDNSPVFPHITPICHFECFGEAKIYREVNTPSLDLTILFFLSFHQTCHFECFEETYREVNIPSLDLTILLFSHYTQPVTSSVSQKRIEK